MTKPAVGKTETFPAAIHTDGGYVRCGYAHNHESAVPFFTNLVHSAKKKYTFPMNEQESIPYVRPHWDDYFMEICRTVAKRATCDRGRSGCVIARDNRILVTGYVGSPAGLPHCDDVGHLLKKMVHENGTVTQHCVRTVHAEQNAICQAAKNGISIDGATLYCKMTPCRTCTMLIINCGIKRVVCEKRYHDSADSLTMFEAAGVEIVHLNDDVQQYDKM